MNTKYPVIEGKIYGKLFNSSTHTIEDSDYEHAWITRPVLTRGSTKVRISEQEYSMNCSWIIFYDNQDNYIDAYSCEAASASDVYGELYMIPVPQTAEYFIVAKDSRTVNDTYSGWKPGIIKVYDTEDNLLYSYSAYQS